MKPEAPKAAEMLGSDFNAGTVDAALDLYAAEVERPQTKAVLAAVAFAGKSYHNTDMWNKEDVAEAFRGLEAEIERLSNHKRLMAEVEAHLRAAGWPVDRMDQLGAERDEARAEVERLTLQFAEGHGALVTCEEGTGLAEFVSKKYTSVSEDRQRDGARVSLVSRWRTCASTSWRSSPRSSACGRCWRSQPMSDQLQFALDVGAWVGLLVTSSVLLVEWAAVARRR